MATASQPISIATPSTSQSHSNIWSSPASVTSSMGIHPAPIFNVGSFSSGSMMSVASFGSKLFSNSPSQYIHPLDPNVYKCRVSSSLETDRASKILAMNHEIANKEEELCRNYNCCGLDISDLHALLEHFEDAHVVVFDSIVQGLQPLSAILPAVSIVSPLQASSPASSSSSSSSSPPPASSSALTQPEQGTAHDGMSGGIGGGESQRHLSAPTPIRTSSDSALAGALGETQRQQSSSSSPMPSPLRTSFSGAGAPSCSDSSSSSSMFPQQQQQQQAQRHPLQQQQHPMRHHQSDDMDIGMELDFDLDYDVSMQGSPAPSSSGSGPSSNGSSPEEQALHSFNANGSASQTSFDGSMMSMQQQQQQQQAQQAYSTATANGLSAPPATTASALSSPPDTPLLATPVSPSQGAFGLNTTTLFGNNNGNNNSIGVWGADGSLNSAALQMHLGLGTSSLQQQQMHMQQQQPKGPSAFDSIHLHMPPKSAMQFGGAGGRLAGAFPHSFAAQHAHLLNQQQQQRMFLARNGNNGMGSAAGMHAPTLGALNAQGAYSTAEYDARVLGLSSSAMNGYMKGGQEKFAATAIPPSLLLGNGGGSMTSAWNTPMTTPAQSRSGSPTGSGAGASGVKKEAKVNINTNAAASSSSSVHPSGSSSAPTTPLTSTPLLLQKPFKCPKPGCMKSYKQANGLKYHLTHGQCLFTPSAELLALSEEGLSEREAERKLRPFCCQVPPCQRRYKNMNGLRYHYQHSGEHGAVGLAMLAAGTHDATKSQPSPPQVSIALDDALPLSPTGSNTSPQQTHAQASTNSSSGPIRHNHNHHRTSPPASAPSTPTSTALHRMQQQQAHARKFVFTNALNNGMSGVGMSQPPSAYASPYASPAPTRSGSPQNQNNQNQSQSNGAQVYGGLTQQNMLYQQQLQQQQVQPQGAWM